MAVKTDPGSLGAGKQRLAKKLLSQQLQREPPSQPTRLGSRAGLNPRNPAELRARATVGKAPSGKSSLRRDGAAQLC